MSMLSAVALAVSAAVIVPTDVIDYPGSAKDHGSVTVSLTISKGGQVTACQLARASAVAPLDEAACKIAATLRYRNAAEDDGTAVESEYALTLHFLTPGMQRTEADLPLYDGNDIRIVYQPRNVPGGDIERAAAMASPPKRLPTSDVPAYPLKAIRQDLTGRTGAIVGVNAKGRPTSCDLVHSSGHPLLDRNVCEFVMEN